jgi:hypothetical protein
VDGDAGAGTPISRIGSRASQLAERATGLVFSTATTRAWPHVHTSPASVRPLASATTARFRFGA